MRRTFFSLLLLLTSTIFSFAQTNSSLTDTSAAEHILGDSTSSEIATQSPDQTITQSSDLVGQSIEQIGEKHEFSKLSQDLAEAFENEQDVLEKDKAQPKRHLGKELIAGFFALILISFLTLWLLIKIFGLRFDFARVLAFSVVIGTIGGLVQFLATK